MNRVAYLLDHLVKNGAITALLTAACLLFVVALMLGHVMTWQAIVLVALSIVCLLVALGLFKGAQIEAFGVKINLSLQGQLETIKDQNLLLTNYIDANQPQLSRIEARIGAIEATLGTPSIAGLADEKPPRNFIELPDRKLGPIKNDPQKHRWGEKSERGGYRLDAEFRELPQEGWVRIVLTVRAIEAGVKLIGPVTFLVHPTFVKDVIRVESSDSVAELALTARGGFTVGAWIHYSGIELELDLATHPKAPKVVREF